MQDFDAIILGGGPAGLLLAKELSPRHSVLVLEKERIGQTRRSWLTYADRWQRERFPSTLITNSFPAWTFHTADPRPLSLIIKDSFICFDEHAFLSFLANRADLQGAVICERQSFSKMRRLTGGGCSINNKWKANLVIDCTGSGSALLQKYGLIAYPLSINCYGYTAGFRHLPNKNYYLSFDDGHQECANLGITKTGSRQGFVTLVTYTDRPMHHLEQRMRAALKRFSIQPHTVIEEKNGSYLSGILKKRAVDNVFFFGDAGFYSPAWSGMGFNEVLRQHRTVADHLSRCIDENTFDEASLRPPENLAQTIDNLFFRLVGLLVSNAPYESFRSLVRIGSDLPSRTLRRMFRNELSDKEIVAILQQAAHDQTIVPLIKNMRKDHALPMLETLARLDKDLILEELHNLVFKHHRIKLRDLY